MSDPFEKHAKSIIMSGIDTFEITPSDSTDLDTRIRAFITDGSGDVSVVTSTGETRVIPSEIIVAGIPFLVICTRVNATDTTATTIWGLV